MRCEHGKCNNLGFMQEQKALPSTIIKLFCTTLSLRIPRSVLSLHKTSNLCSIVPVDMTRCSLAFSIFCCIYCVTLVQNWILGVADVYVCSYVTLSEILHAHIHDELNNSHKRKCTTRTHNHIETLCMVRCLNTIPHSFSIIKEWPFLLRCTSNPVWKWLLNWIPSLCSLTHACSWCPYLH